MFDTAYVLVDDNARPVLIIPEYLPEGATYLNIVEGGIDIGVNDNVLGRIRDMDDASLMILGLQDEVGMSTFEGKEGEDMPDTIQYVATVRDTRESA